MNKILLALSLLGAGAGGFLTARQATIQLQHEAKATRAAWLAQTQLVAAAQRDQVGLIEHVRELKQTLTQPPAVAENALWTVLQTSRTGHLTPELRERLFEELGFNWRSSAEFIVVSKDTVRDIQMQAIRDDGKLTDIAATVLALTPRERGQVKAAIQRVQTEFKDWALSHTERSEPKDDIVAQYTLPGAPTMSQNMSNNFANGVFDALGRERAELFLASAQNWMMVTVGPVGEGTTLIVKRYLAGNEQRLKFQMDHFHGISGGDLSEFGLPRPFLPIFPNGWADVAKREGFELPEKSQEK
jgi:hypothetical protein